MFDLASYTNLQICHVKCTFQHRHQTCVFQLVRICFDLLSGPYHVLKELRFQQDQVVSEMKPLKLLLVAGFPTHPSLRQRLAKCDCTPWSLPNSSGFASGDYKRATIFLLSVLRNSSTPADVSNIAQLVDRVIEEKSDRFYLQLCEVIDIGGNFLESFAFTCTMKFQCEENVRKK